jgi:soluble lytic murein transglycosylase
VRSFFKIVVEVCGALLASQLLLAARPAVESVPVALRSLASGAAKPAGWPQLRHYAESQKAPEQRALAYFALGYREYEAGEYTNAANDLGQAAGSQFFLADYATYYSAASARKANDSARAAEGMRDFSSRFPASPLRTQALELLAEALIDSQHGQEAVQILTAEPRTREHATLSLLLAKAYESAGNPAQAVRAFQEVYFAFPTSPLANEAGEDFRRLGSSLGADCPQPTEEMETARAGLLFNASLYTLALEGYEALLSSRPASPLTDVWKLGRARCLLRLRRDQDASAALSTGFTTPAVEAERLALLVEVRARADDSTGALQALSQTQAISAHSSSFESALFAAGNLFFRLRDWQNAGLQYQTLSESFPQGDHIQDADWRLIWCYYLGGDHDRARQALKDYITHFTASPRLPAALYWLGRLEEEHGETRDARAIFSLLRTRFAHSFYAEQARLREPQLSAARAAETLQTGSSASEVEQLIPPRDPSPISSCPPEVAPESLGPVLALQELSLNSLAEQYLKNALAARPAQPDLRFFLGRLEAKESQVSAALYDATKAVPDYPFHEFPELPKEMWSLLYPQSYWKFVQRQARADRIDPYLAMGLIRQESAFNPRATSSANAHGLMQILPETASRSRRPARIRSTGNRLYNPTYNIRFGCSYLRNLLKEFNGQPEMALAAYNAGDFRVREWLRTNSFRDSSEFLEAIPIRATRIYVEAVLRDAAIYRQLLTGSAKFAACTRQSQAENLQSQKTEGRKQKAEGRKQLTPKGAT